MEKKLVDFIQRLRGAGVRVSVAESLDAFRATEVAGIENRETFRVSLRASLVKDVVDYPIFDKLFDLYFSVVLHGSREQKETAREIEEELEAKRFQQELQEFEQAQQMTEEEFLRELEQMEQRMQETQGQNERREDESSGGMTEEEFLKELEALRRELGEEPDTPSESSDSTEAEKQFREELEKAQKEAPKPSEADENQSSQDKETGESQQSDQTGEGQQDETPEGQNQKGQENGQAGEGQTATGESQEGGESEGQSGQTPNESGQAGNETSEGAEGQADTGSDGQSGQGPGGQEGQIAGEGDQTGNEGSGGKQARELSLPEKIAKAVLEGDRALMREIAQEGVSQVEEINLDRLDRAQKEAGQHLNLWEMKNRLRQELTREMGDGQANRFLEEAFSKLEDEIASAVEEEAIRRYGEEALDKIMRKPKLEEVDFNDLRYDSSMDLIEEMRARIAKLARKLASRISRREKQAKRGKVDIRRTIRKSLQTGGVPLDLAFRQKKFTKPELVLLCDVSGSVAIFSEFMLQLVYALQDKFTKVQSFAFVDRIDEITEYFEEDTAARAIQRARSSSNVSWDGYSDFGNSFREFVAEYLEAVTSKTTVIVLGDARNNNNPSRVGSLRLIGDKAKKLLWLNPEPAEEWDSGDSIMSVYARVCDQVFECRNLAQLEHVVQEVLK